MSLEQALEHDIVVFLDEETAPKEKASVVRREELALLSKDYPGDIKKHLKKNELERAKGLFNELKEGYGHIPEDHPQEKKKIFEQVQESYVAIYNYIHDKARTQILLERYDQTPDSVFDEETKPVDLQKTQTAIPKLPEFEPLTIDSLKKKIEAKMNAGSGGGGSGASSGSGGGGTGSSTGTGSGSGGGGGGELSLPPAPAAVQAASALQEATAAALRATEALQKTTTKTEQAGQGTTEQIVSFSLHRADSLSNIAPERSLAILARAAKAIEQLSPEQQKSLQALFSAIESKAIEQVKINDFKKKFNETYAAIANLGRARSEEAGERYAALMKEAQSFESEHPKSKGVFTDKLKTLKTSFTLYSEDEIAGRVKDLIMRIKNAKAGSSEQRAAFQAYVRYVQNLPPGPSKEMLESRLPKPHPEHALQPIVTRIVDARRNGDRVVFFSALGDLERAIKAMPPSPDARALLERIAFLRSARNQQVHA